MTEIERAPESDDQLPAHERRKREEQTVAEMGDEVERIFTEMQRLRRRGMIDLHEDTLAQLINLPLEWRVLSMWADWSRNVVRLLVQHDDLPPVIEMCEPPTIGGTWRHETAWITPTGEACPAEMAEDAGAKQFHRFWFEPSPIMSMHEKETP